MDDKSKKRPIGRPTKYKPEYCQLVINYLKDGKTYREFAAHIGVSPETLNKWEKKHDEFMDAKKRARNEAYVWWMNQGREGLWTQKKSRKTDDGGWESEERRLNERLWCFCMKNIYGWRDKEPENDQDRNVIISMAYDRTKPLNRSSNGTDITSGKEDKSKEDS